MALEEYLQVDACHEADHGTHASAGVVVNVHPNHH